MTSGIAHDFNNVLTTILGTAQLSLMNLQKGNNNKHNIVDDLETINNKIESVSSIQLMDIANEILDLDKLSTLIIK